MSENVQITPGTGVTIGADSVTDITLGSAQIQYIKIMDGAIGGTNKAGVTSNGLAVDGSAVTQPISATSLPLPTGASTSVNQSTANSYLSTIATNTTNAGTPTVSGTVTVLQPTAANLNATVVQSNAADLLTTSYLNDGSGNAISSTSGSLDVFVSNFPATVAVTQSTSPWVVSGTVTTSPNVNIHDGSGNAITSTTGSLNVDVTNAVSVSGTVTVVQSTGSNLHVDVDNFPSTQNVNVTNASIPVTQSGSWTVSLTSESIEIGTVDQGTPNTLANAWPVELSDGTNLLGTSSHPLRIDPTGTTTQPVSLVSTTITGTVAVTQSTSPWVISGTVTANAGTNLNTSALALDTSVNGILVSQGSTTSGEKGPLIQGAVTTSSPSYTTAQTSPLSLTLAGALRVDASATTQPISGTVTANAGTGTFTVGQSTGTNLHTVVDSGSITIANSTIAVTQSTSPWVVSLSSTTITGTVTVAGNLTHNNAAPAANNVGVLPAVASSATPTYNAGDQVLLSTDLSGNLRVTIDSTSSEQNVNLNQVGGSAISIGQATMAASLPVVIASNQSSIPVTLTSTTITGTVAVTQSTSPWVDNITQWNSVALGSPSAYGTSPGTVNVIGVNAFITNTPTVTANAGTGTFAVSAASLPLPTGASTSADQTNGSQKTQIVDGSGNVIASTSNALNVEVVNTVPVSGTVAVTQSTSPWVTSFSDVSPSTQNVTVQDTGSTTTSGANSQPIYTGTPTAGSIATFTISSQNSIEIQVTGTWTGTLQPEVSLDGGTTWYKSGGHQKGVSFNSSSFTSNFQVETNVAGFTNFRIRAIAAMTGTAIIKIVETSNEASIYVTNPIAIVDGTGTSNQVAVTAANALKVDGSAVTQPISGTVTSNQGTAAALSGAWPVEITDGTNILGTSSHPVRTDPTGTTTQPVSGTVTANAGTGNFNVVGTTTDGTTTETNFLVVGGETNDATAQYQPIPLGTTGRSVIVEGVSGGTAVPTEDKANAAISSSVGTASGFAVGVSGLYNTTQPVPTNGQQVEVQTDQSANLLNFPGVQTKTGAAWTSSTSSGTFQYPTGTTTIGAPLGGTSVFIQLDQTTTLTGGAVTFQGTYDGTNWITIPAAQVLTPGQPYTALTNPYTFIANTNQSFLIVLNGMQNIRLDLSTAISGTGTVTPYWTLVSQAFQPIMGSISLGVSSGKSVVMKTGSLVTTAVTANQVVLTYTVTTGKTFFLQYIRMYGYETTQPANTNPVFLGSMRLQNPSGTDLITDAIFHATSQTENPYTFSEPIPVASGTVIQVVTTPSATTSFTWMANFGGYEK